MYRPLLVMAWSGACLLAQKVPSGTIVDGDVGLRLDNVVTSTASGYWGAVLVAVQGRPLLAKGYGLADRQKVPNGPQSLFDLGGASQQLTVLAALRLAADKKLRLEDTVAKYLSDWPTDKSAVTIDYLIRHTTGLAPEVKWEGNAANASRTALAAIARTPLVDRPGQALHYSGVNASLLALVLEEATQQRFDRLLADRVCKPFGMNTAALCNGRLDAKLLTLRRSDANERGDLPSLFDLNWAHRGARGVMASVLDVHNLLVGLLAGKCLDAEGLDVLWRPLAGGDAYGVTVLPGNGESYLRVHGETQGYRARWIVSRSDRSWVVLLSEDYGNIDALESALVGELGQLRAAARAGPVTTAPATPEAPPDGSATPGPAPKAGAVAKAGASVDKSAAPVWPAAAAERFVGTFALPRGGGSLRIERDGQGLRLFASGLQASARLAEGHWPPPGEDVLRKAEDLGLRLLGRLLADEAAADADAFLDASAGGALRKLLREWQGKHGVPRRIELVGTRLKGPGESWFRLLGASAQLDLQVQWGDERRWKRCEVANEPPPFAVFLEFARSDCAVANALAGPWLVLTIEGEGPARRLVWEDKSPGRDGLLDCELVPADH